MGRRPGVEVGQEGCSEGASTRGDGWEGKGWVAARESVMQRENGWVGWRGRGRMLSAYRQ